MLIVLLGQMAKMMQDVINKDPREWSKEERMFVFLNRTAYTLECMRICDQEIADRKLLKFLRSKNDETL
jgi:hypothetical protein